MSKYDRLDVEQMLADQYAYDRQEDLRRLLTCYPDVTIGELLSYGEGWICCKRSGCMTPKLERKLGVKPQAPDLIKPPECEEAEQMVASAKVLLSEALAYLESVNKLSEIQCCACHAKFPIATQEYIQTHWYTRPHGCTEGDYWNRGEANWICPGCGYRMRFDASPNKYDWMYRPELVALKPLFAKVHACYCEFDAMYSRPCDNCAAAGKKLRFAV
jgi:hypothetical protein